MKRRGLAQWPPTRLLLPAVLTVGCFLPALTIGTVRTVRAEAKRPNFVIVLADDLGYGDLGCYGNSQVRTPHLDRFAAQGMRFTDYYAPAPNCSPSRAGLMTGRTPYRLGIYNWIPYGSPMHVRRGELTIATLLRRHGYSTCHVGKWHLNGSLTDPKQPQPSDHGFDHWFSTQNNALPSHRNPENFVRNGRPVGPLRGYSAQLVVDEAIRWLTRLRDPQKPFFLFVCFHEPHEPIETDPRFSRLYPQQGKPSPFDPWTSTLAAHHGNITQMDHHFGRLMAALDRLGVSDNTLVFFTSDNGPAITRWHPHGSAGPLRAKKGHLYEGGIRVPGLLRFPGRVKPGVVCREPVCGVDLLPTICQLAGVPLPQDRPLDGTSWVPLWEQGGRLQRNRPLYWQFNFARSEPRVALRHGPWKLLATITHPLPGGGDIRAEDQEAIQQARLVRFFLYNLRDDPGEQTELGQRHPQVLAEMKQRMQKYYDDVQAESPRWPAWHWPRAEGKRIRRYIQQRRRQWERNPRQRPEETLSPGRSSE